ncbi:hypothetical protein BGZ99_001488, partial [Dissophora globulifera]
MSTSNTPAMSAKDTDIVRTLAYVLEPKQPDAYTGKVDSEECLNFTDSFEEYYTVLQLAEPLWVKYIILDLTGDARSWWRASDLTIETLWTEFRTTFIARLTPPDSVNKARESLKKLKQGHASVAAYTAEFRHYLRLIPNINRDVALYKQLRLQQPTSIDVAITEATIAQAPARIAPQAPVDPMAMEIDNLRLEINALRNAVRGS